MRILRSVKLALVILSLTFGNMAFAGTGDTSIAVINLSGSVPEVFSVTARGLPGDLDLTPNVVVNNRLIGILHFKFNESAASITIGGSVGGVGYTFASPFSISTPACTSLDNTVTGLDFAGGGVALGAAVDYKSAAAGALVGNGIEEDCQLVASWGGTAAALPLAGIVTVTVTVTMIAL